MDVSIRKKQKQPRKAAFVFAVCFEDELPFKNFLHLHLL